MDITQDFIEMLENSIQCSYSDFFVLRADNIMENYNFNNLINSICLRFNEMIIHYFNNIKCIFQINNLYFKLDIDYTRDDSYALYLYRYNYLPT